MRTRILFLLMLSLLSFGILKAQITTIGECEGNNQYLPSYSYYKYTLSQQIYSEEEIEGTGTIYSIAFYNSGSTKTRTYNIYMVNTEKSEFTSANDWIVATSDDLMFSGSVTMTSGVWTTIEFDNEFAFEGPNLAVIIDDNTGSWSSGMSCCVFSTLTSQAIRVYSDGTNYNPFSPSGYSGTLHNEKNTIQLNINYNSGDICRKPTQFRCQTTTTNTATLEWIARNDETAWEMVYSTDASFDPDTVTPINVTTNPYTITGLIANTVYYAYVRANCDDGNLSAWSGKCEFMPFDGMYFNIANNNLIIPGNYSGDCLVTGSTTDHYIEVGLGYHGTITLQNCTIDFSGGDIHSPIRLVGQNGQSNDDPLTVVNLILEGTNTIQNNGGGRACIQVDQGTQINISAIDPCNNNSGILIAEQQTDRGGAAIGSLNRSYNSNEPTASAPLFNESGNPTGGNGTTAGGNVVISSGTITARGGHGAGIGGGYQSYYDGMIVVYGGIVNASAIWHAAGIGSGCPTGNGVIQVYTPHSAVIALPPSLITATGAGGGSPVALGLAGTKVRVYIGDPLMTDCPIQVYTQDYTPDADIYVDLSQDPDINQVVSATVDPTLLDIHQVYFGTTDASGLYSTTGKLNNNTTFFTDAVGITPSSYGHPYLPTVTTLPTGGNVQLNRLMADFTIETFPSSPLVMGYSSSDALVNASCVKLVYNDANPIVNVQFDLAKGGDTDFDDLIFLAADSATVIPAPTTLTQGETYYIIIPIQTGKGAYLFSDVFRIIGEWQGSSTSYIRQIVNQIVGDMYTEYICSGGSYMFHGEELTEPGIYSSVTTTTSQCQAVSSVELLNLVVNPPVTFEFDDQGCDEYVWNEVTYNETGAYSQQLTSSQGCDSIVTLHLTVNYSDTTYLDTIVCSSYTWYDSTYVESGIYNYVAQNMDGCDSLLVLNLTVGYEIISDTTAEVCNSFNWNGVTYTETGDYDYQTQTLLGCDSIVTLHLTVNYSDTTTLDVTACDSYVWNEETYNTTGVYEYMGQTVHGCDSIVTLNLTVNYSDTTYLDTVVCGSYTWYDSTYVESGIYSYVAQNVDGCDSLLVLNLTVGYAAATDTTAVACDWFDWYGVTYTETGDYDYQTQTVLGCDSIVTLHLTVNYSDTTVLDVTACDSYEWNEETYNTTGVYEYIGQTVYGCDSIVTLNLTVNHSDTTYLDIIACESYEWYDTTYLESGIYSYLEQTVDGCDSLLVLNLTIGHAATSDTTLTVCDWYDWNGVTYTATGDYDYQTQTVLGCDSVATLHLTVNYSDTTYLESVTACEAYEWYGETYTETGVYAHMLSNAMGCDSLLLLNVTVDQEHYQEDVVAVCYSYDWRGETYTESGMYTDVGPNPMGCDTTFVLRLTIGQDETGDTTAFVCDGFQWYEHYCTSTGQYEHMFQTVIGCDSLVTLDLTYAESFTTAYDTVVCDRYPWPSEPGGFLTETGHYLYEGYTSEGCDSIVDMELTVNYTPDLLIDGLSQVAMTTHYGPFYVYYLADSAELSTCAIDWQCSNPDWVMILGGNPYECRIAPVTLGQATLTATTHCQSTCDTTYVFEINASHYGVGDNGEDEIQLFPNPADNQVTIQAPQINHVRMLNSYGQVVKDQAYDEVETTTLEVGALAHGIYLVEITTISGKKIKRLILSK